MTNNKKIAIIGLGYVGLPLAHGFSQSFEIIAFDIDQERITELNSRFDRTSELTDLQLAEMQNCEFTSDEEVLADADVFIVTVPTPVDSANIPDLTALRSASKMIGKYLSLGNIVVFESTVYPGATREVCIPLLEQGSGLVLNTDFFVGYSPERINPGDRKNTLQTITKITSGSNDYSRGVIDELYGRVVEKTHSATSIEIAEAAKVIENIQRDVNIALMNEFSLIFQKLNIETKEVLAASGTKWNFLNFEPGLVGGHCIGVDPYYLTHKSQQIGYLPEVILAGRNLNERFPKELVSRFVKECVSRDKLSSKSKRVLVLGITFKEDCPDVRNTKTTSIVDDLLDFGFDVDIFDPVADIKGLSTRYQNLCIPSVDRLDYVGVILAVKHREFRKLSLSEIEAMGSGNPIVFDIKSILPSGTNVIGV